MGWAKFMGNCKNHLALVIHFPPPYRFWIVIALSILVGGNAWATSSHSVRPYFKKNGALVERHRQTNPNRSKQDNWSTKENGNPYTGKQGTVDPYRSRLKRHKN